MSEGFGSGRRKSKTEIIVIDDDEPPGQQPAEKRTKLEGEPFLPPPPPPPPDELVDLQQQLLKKEQMFQRACRAAREAELRAERAENIIDSKQGIRQEPREELDSELEKRLDELSIQLAEARRRESESTRENDTLKLEMIRLRRRCAAANRVASVPLPTTYVTPKAELDEMPSSREIDLTQEVHTLKKELEALRNREDKTNRMSDDLTSENAALKAELEVAAGRGAESKDDCELARENAALKDVIKSLSGFRDQFEEVKRQSEVDRARDREIIANMAAKVKRYEKQRFEAMKKLLPQRPAAGLQHHASSLQLPAGELQPAADQLQQHPQQPAAVQSLQWPVRQFINYADKADPINILEPYRPGLKDSFTVDSAVAHIQAKKNLASDCGKRSFNMYYPDRVGEGLECRVCRRCFMKKEVIAHFLSAKHIDLMRSCKAAVSLPAVMFWLQQLQTAATAAATAEAACAAAAANPIASAGAQPVATAATSAPKDSQQKRDE